MNVIAARIRAGARVAILDLGPERAASAVLRDAASAMNGVYLREPDPERAMLDELCAMLGRKRGSLGIDLERARTLISFGVPVLERGHGTIVDRWREGRLEIIQVDSRQSRTALAASRWIPTAPGAEAQTAHLLASETPRWARPAVAIGGGIEVAKLNIALGAIGVEGGIVPRAALPWETDDSLTLTAAGDGSISVLIVDASRASHPVPWPTIRQKLAGDAVVAMFDWRADRAAAAHFALPVHAPFEIAEDAAGSSIAPAPVFAVSAPLVEADPGSHTAAEYLNQILAAAGKPALSRRCEDIVRERIDTLAAMKGGRVVSLADGTAAEIQDGAELNKKLAGGAFVWTADAMKEPLRAALQETATPAGAPSPVTPNQNHPFLLITANGPDESLPLMSKLYQESGLYAPPTLVRLHPGTAARAGVSNGARAVVETPHGSVQRSALVDPAVLPGLLESSGCDLDQIFDRPATPANIRRA